MKKLFRSFVLPAVLIIASACGGSGSVTPPPPPGVPIAAWGDSFTAGTGASTPADAYPAVVGRALNRTVFNGGVGGETSTQILARIQADQSHRGDVTILWMGRNNSFNPSTVKADIAAAVAHLTTTHFIVLSIMNGTFANELKGGSIYNTIIQLNTDLATTYPSNYIDVRALVVAGYNPNLPQDVTDHNNDVSPTSLRFDQLHLKSAGYAIVAQAVVNFIQQKGW